VTRASGAAAGKKREKGEARQLELPVVERATRRREARGSRDRGDCGRKGKAGGWMEREGSRRFAMVGWAGGAGLCHAGWLAGKKEGERECWAAHELGRSLAIGPKELGG
jgi:hypothetical protein